MFAIGFRFSAITGLELTGTFLVCTGREVTKKKICSKGCLQKALSASWAKTDAEITQHLVGSVIK
jgi:hypothetical protein